MKLQLLLLRAEKFLQLIGSRVSLKALFFHRVLVAAEHRSVLKARGGANGC